MSKLIIHRQDKRERFGILDMSAIEDKRLSDASLGLLLYLNSRPTGWETSVEGIANQRKSGKAAIKTCLKELQTCGYMDIERIKGDEATPVQTVWTVREVSTKPDLGTTPAKTKQAGNRLDTKTQAIKGDQPNNNKVVSIDAYQVENQLDTKTLSNSYQAGNQLNTPYQAGNRPDGKTAACRSTQGVSYQAGNRPVLKENKNIKKEHSSASDEPMPGDKSFPKKPPASKSGYTPSDDARALVNHLSDCLKQHGAKTGQFDARWFFSGCKVAEKLLKLETPEDLTEAITFLVNDKYVGQGINNMARIDSNLIRWQRTQSGQPQAGPDYGRSDEPSYVLPSMRRGVK